MTIIEQIKESYPDVPFIILNGFDDAIIGVYKSVSLAYSVEKIIHILIADGMEEQDALDDFDYNIQSFYAGEHAPIYIHIFVK